MAAHEEDRRAGAGASPEERDARAGFGAADPTGGSHDARIEEPGEARLEQTSQDVGAIAHRAQDEARELADRTRERATELAEEGKERAHDAAEHGRARFAGSIDRMSDRLEAKARSLEEQGGVSARAGEVVHRASDALESGAEYLRSHDLPMIRDDVIEQIRERPLVAVGVALGAGFLIGSIGGSADEDRDRHYRDREESRRSERFAARMQRRAGHRDQQDDDEALDRHDRGGRFAAMRSRWDEYDELDEHDDDSDGGIRAQLGRAVIAGVGALLSRQIRSRIAGRGD